MSNLSQPTWSLPTPLKSFGLLCLLLSPTAFASIDVACNGGTLPYFKDTFCPDVIRAAQSYDSRFAPPQADFNPELGSSSSQNTGSSQYAIPRTGVPSGSFDVYTGQRDDGTGPNDGFGVIR